MDPQKPQLLRFFSCVLILARKVRFIIEDTEDVLERSFDYIIVGGGTSGCPLAATLSERYSVLLVERGGSPYGNPLIEEEKNFGFPLIVTDRFTSISQRFVSEDGVVNHRGRVLGGSTTINAGLYSRASEEFVKRAGCDGELVGETYEWMESKVVFLPSLSAWQSVAADGMVEAGIRPFNGFILKHIKGTKVAGSTFDVHGRRHTAADLLGFGNPKKITLLLNATVQNVIFRVTGDGKQPRAHGIKFIRSNGNPKKFYEVYLNHPKDSGSWGEVILCAGALGSPQILLLSGTGPKEHLMDFNITPLIDATEVGKSMQDNPTIRVFLNYSSHALYKQHPDPPKVAGIVNGFRFIVETSLLYRSFNTSITVSLGIKMADPISRGSLRAFLQVLHQQPMEVIKGIIHGFSTLLLLSLIALPPLSSCFSTSEARKVQFMIEDIKDVLGRSFDYIIVGGGTTGCPLAATLSKRYSVLLVERGGLPYGNPLIEEKKNFSFSQTGRFTSISQKFISKDGVVNHRGRVLGGSTAINGGFYSRASDDYIKRARWDPELVREAYEWAESKIVFRPSLTAWQSVAADSMVEAGIRPFNGFSLEHLKGTKVGGSIFDVHGRRHTSADLLGTGNSKKITILLNATVQNVIFHDAGCGKQPRAQGIRFIKSNGNPKKFYEVYLNKVSGSWGDVILCAGALGSPQILMLSGIGPKEHLMHFNITPLLDAREVGRSMQDNPSIAMPLNYSSHALHKLHPDPPQVAGIANGFRIIIETSVFSASFNTGILPVLAGKVAYPVSRGLLNLVSRDPRKNPSVKFNYLAEEKDLDECAKMVHLIEKVAQSTSISSFLGRKQSRLSMDGMSSYQELKDLCKKNVRTIYHYHGGCVVGSVVNRDYRVLGVKGLRVLDGSTFHDSPGTNPMATLLMLGRYQGIKMLRERDRETRTSHLSESGE